MQPGKHTKTVINVSCRPLFLVLWQHHAHLPRAVNKLFYRNVLLLRVKTVGEMNTTEFRDYMTNPRTHLL